MKKTFNNIVFPVFGLDKKSFMEKYYIKGGMYDHQIVEMIEKKTGMRFTIWGVMKWRREIGIKPKSLKRAAYNFDDKVGKKFGRLKVLKFEGYKIISHGKKRSLWSCLCDCGNIVTVQGNQLATGNTKSCGCQKIESTKISNTKTKTKHILDGFSYVWQSYKKRAKDRGFNFNLSKDQFRKFTQGCCYYCGKLPMQKRKVRIEGKEQGFIYNGIDRIDSTKGYAEDNCVSCCKLCNIAKGDRSVNEFLGNIKRIYENIKTRQEDVGRDNCDLFKRRVRQ